VVLEESLTGANGSRLPTVRWRAYTLPDSTQQSVPRFIAPEQDRQQGSPSIVRIGAEPCNPRLISTGRAVQMRWSFKELPRGDKVREPIQGEFFSTDTIRNAAQAIVRESIQNSLDASLGGSVRVRFYVSGEDGALPAAQALRYFEGALPHYHANGNGLLDCPETTEPCRFLVCEDFNTKGLQGDPAEWTPPDERNNFFHFFRAEGRSAKGEHDRGRWGVGKYVFPRSSRVKSFFAVTVREDDQRRLLMGQAILKSHKIRQKHYQSDGWLAILDDGVPMPIEDQGMIDALCADFRLTRAKRPGLSVVVPWCDSEIKGPDLLEAVARDYFYAILKRDLIVDIETPQGKQTLSADTLLDVLETRPELRSLRPFIELAKWVIAVPTTEHTPVRLDVVPGRAPRWPEKVFSSPAQAAELQARYRAGEQLGFRVHILVRKKRAPDAASFFDVVLVQDDSEEIGKPIFIREGIIISDVRPLRTRGTRALVLIEDPPLATLLGDSENPAHTQWQAESSNYKGKYTYGAAYIAQVTRSAFELTQAIVDTEQETDTGVLMDYFPVPPSSVKKEEPAPGPGTPSPTPPPPKPRRFQINRIVGGFSVKTGDDGVRAPDRIEIRVAYDVRRGNPLARYRPDDFRLDEPPVTIERHGAYIVERGNNRLVMAIHQRDFSLVVTGFDPNRDLFLQASAQGDFNDPTV
jgi:hypothetical protein